MIRQSLGIPSIGDHIGSLIQSTTEFHRDKEALGAQLADAHERF